MFCCTTNSRASTRIICTGGCAIAGIDRFVACLATESPLWSVSLTIMAGHLSEYNETLVVVDVILDKDFVNFEKIKIAR